MWENITSIITNLVTLMGTMTTSLLTNVLFQIVLGIVFFSIAMGVVFGLVRKIKTIYSRYDYSVGDNFGAKGSKIRRKYVTKIMFSDIKHW